MHTWFDTQLDQKILDGMYKKDPRAKNIKGKYIAYMTGHDMTSYVVSFFMHLCDSLSLAEFDIHKCKKIFLFTMYVNLAICNKVSKE